MDDPLRWTARESPDGWELHAHNPGNTHPRLALVLSSILFGLIHVNLMTFVPLTLFAVVLALLYERTGTLLAPMAAHAFFNAINFYLFILTAK